MALLDFLIDQTNKVPEDGAKYYYNLDKVWTPGSLDSISVKEGLIAYDVRRNDNGGYTFRLESMTGVYCCNYGWALIKITDLNMAKFQTYLELRKKADEAANAAEEMFNTIETLNPQNDKPGDSEA